MFRKFSYTLLIGASNAGKTTFFLNYVTKNKKIIFSGVEKQFIIPPNKTDIDIDVFVAKNLNTAKISFNEPTSILIDEIHFCSESELKFICSILEKFKNVELFISMIPACWDGNYLPNTCNLLSNANNLEKIESPCTTCGKKTIQSGKANSISESVVCSKISFFAQCIRCKNK